MSNIMGFGIDPDDFEDWNEFDDELKKRESFFFCKRIPVMMSVRSWLR